MAIYMCERTFPTALTPEDFAAAGKVLAPCLQARDVRWVASHMASDGTRSVCVFEADNAEAVREANRTANMPFDRIWSADIYRAT